jgi:hypothetical protein
MLPQQEITTDVKPSHHISPSCAIKVKFLSILEVQLLKIYYILENIVYQFWINKE